MKRGHSPNLGNNYHEFVGDQMNQINYVLQRMAAERSISEEEMRDIIQNAIQARPSIQEAFGGREPTVEEFISSIADMLEKNKETL